MANLLLTMLGLAAGVYIIVCLALYLAQERLLFFPEVLPADYRHTFPGRFEEARIPVEGATISALHFKVEQPKGVILYLPGNAGSVRGWGTAAGELGRRGYDVLFPDYRGFGKSTGKLTDERMLLSDAAATYAYLLERYPQDQIVIYGRSLGTGIAVHLAKTNRPRLLLLETPYISIQSLARRRFPFVPPFLVKYPLRTDRWIGDVACPVYLFHGTADELIPYQSSLQLLRMIKSKGELVTIEGGTHNNLPGFRPYQEALDRILQ